MHDRPYLLPTLTLNLYVVDRRGEAQYTHKATGLGRYSNGCVNFSGQLVSWHHEAGIGCVEVFKGTLGKNKRRENRSSGTGHRFSYGDWCAGRWEATL